MTRLATYLATELQYIYCALVANRGLDSAPFWTLIDFLYIISSVLAITDYLFHPKLLWLRPGLILEG